MTPAILSPHCCWYGLGLGASEEAQTAQRDLRKLETTEPCPALPWAGITSARKCPGAGFAGRWDQPGGRWEGRGHLRSSPACPSLPPGLRRGWWQAGSEGRSPVPQPCETHPPPCASPPGPEERQLTQPILAQPPSLTVVWTRRWGPASPSTGRAAVEATLPLWPLLVWARCHTSHLRGPSACSLSSYAAGHHTAAPAFSRFALRRRGLHKPLGGDQARCHRVPRAASSPG